MRATRSPNAAPAVLDPVNDPRWRDFVDAAPGAAIFHHPTWLSVIQSRYGYPVAACALLAADGAVQAGFPVALVRTPLTAARLVAFPFSDLCQPLGTPPDVYALGPVAADLRTRMGASMEVRGPFDAPDARPGARYRHHVLTLAPDMGEVERRFRRSSVMRGVRRARREGLRAQRRVDVHALDSFFRLHVETRSRLGAPTQPRGFVRDLERLFAEDLGFVLLVERGAEIAAAAVFLHHGRVLTYKYGASDVRALQMRPNNLLFWEAIRWGCENGMDRLDLGRSELWQDGLREFKRSWGADEHELVYTHIGPGAPREADRGVLGRALAAGLRRTPPIVSRIVGEVFYRYAA
jgi:CelD/BcsL family acetyltransferase involved in cellulose biosynthesis